MTLESDFPLGMRVLAVNDDPASLKSLENLLTRCQYNVVSEDERRETIAKAVAHGSCDYLLKPVRLQELRNIWTHVLRRKIVSTDNIYILQDERQQFLNVAVPDDKHKHKHKYKIRPIPTVTEHGRAKEAQRKRLRWTEELHHKFLATVHTLGLNKAVPKKIIELMKVDDLTLDHVSSHFQKYKLYVKKLSAVTGHHALVAAQTKLALGHDLVPLKTHQSIEIVPNSQPDLPQGVPASSELQDANTNHQTIGITDNYLLSYHSSQQQQQQQQAQLMDASGNNSFIGAIDNFPLETAGNFQPNWLQGLLVPSDHPNDNIPLEDGPQLANYSLLDPTEPFYDLIDFNSLNQLLQHDQTMQYDVAATEPTATVLSDLPSVLMTPLFGDSFNSDSDFSQILHPIISNDNNPNFGNHLMQSPQPEWHQTYDQNSSSSSMPNFEVTSTNLLHQASSEDDRNAMIKIHETGQVLQYASASEEGQ
ncbi:two-component response regulator ORR23-like [Zingiber officinale]|uniref:Myb-like domain-containing protein n=1 Tax=Zingiber officinale TaxID=94328 RepID=A0A8J5HFL2_ZINOF|nr:two-component response regulator ORR23-like [Zingiber officinale]KAG6526463.1 hypothetical protein ZIOFF_016448 [Zingiber officinale]